MSRLDLIDERFEEIVRELRSGRIAASPELRERVREIASRPPEPPPQPRRLSLPALGWRRAALVLAPACLAAVLVSALTYGLATSGREERVATPPPVVLESERGSTDTVVPAEKSAAGQTVAGETAAGLPATPGRAQLYEAELTLRVRNLSAATKRALGLTRSFGGYVRTVDFGSGEETGRAYLVVRIPVGSVQKAIVRFSALGEILGQHVSIRDVQPQLDERFRRMQESRREITKLQARLLDPRLSSTQRAALEAELVKEQQRLAALQREQAQAQRRASFATVSLSLRTAKPAAAKPDEPGRIERTFDNAGSILLDEAKVVIYAVVVGAPVLLLLALAVAGARTRRRRAEERLLSR